jgi:dCTP deaminase
MTETQAGVLPDHAIRDMIARGAIHAEPAVDPAQIQPASLDLRLGHVAYRVRASFLTGKGRTLAERLPEFEMHRMDLSHGAVLEKGCVYVVPLMEAARASRRGLGGGQRKKLDRARRLPDARDDG